MFHHSFSPALPFAVATLRPFIDGRQGLCATAFSATKHMSPAAASRPDSLPFLAGTSFLFRRRTNPTTMTAPACAEGEPCRGSGRGVSAARTGARQTAPYARLRWVAQDSCPRHPEKRSRRGGLTGSCSARSAIRRCVSQPSYRADGDGAPSLPFPLLTTMRAIPRSAGGGPRPRPRHRHARQPEAARRPCRNHGSRRRCQQAHHTCHKHLPALRRRLHSAVHPPRAALAARRPAYHSPQTGCSTDTPDPCNAHARMTASRTRQVSLRSSPAPPPVPPQSAPASHAPAPSCVPTPSC